METGLIHGRIQNYRFIFHNYFKSLLFAVIVYRDRGTDSFLIISEI